MTTWLPGWRRRGWRTSARRPVKHQPTIKAIAAELDRRPVQLVKVPGHAGHPLNERADRLAAAAAAQAALSPQYRGLGHIGGTANENRTWLWLGGGFRLGDERG